jgi:hypothetical protein
MTPIEYQYTIRINTLPRLIVVKKNLIFFVFYHDITVHMDNFS